jgi:hypothetical protein
MHELAGRRKIKGHVRQQIRLEALNVEAHLVLAWIVASALVLASAALVTAFAGIPAVASRWRSGPAASPRC